MFFVYLNHYVFNFDLLDLPKCNEYNHASYSIILQNTFMAIDKFGCIDLLLLAFTVILAKSQQDIISGISKLDDLLVVSIFQRKKKRDEMQRDSSAAYRLKS